MQIEQHKREKHNSIVEEGNGQNEIIPFVESKSEDEKKVNTFFFTSTFPHFNCLKFSYIVVDVFCSLLLILNTPRS